MTLPQNPELIQTWFNLDCDELADRYSCIVTTKDRSRWFWKILDFIFWVVGGFKKSDFMRRATTIGPVIAYPEGTVLSHVSMNDYITLTHEAVHVKQCAKLGLGEPWIGTLLFLILYLFVPLPAWRSWFRFKFEREAYLVEYKTTKKFGFTPDIEHYVKVLSGPDYLYTWPEAKVRAWFKRAVSSS
jgi:hypothetical protein